MKNYRCRLHRLYSLYLSSKPDILRHEYQKAIVYWQNSFSGTKHKHLCDFTIIYKNGYCEHVQVQPINRQYPLDKFLYAQNQLENWRWITATELTEINGQDKTHCPSH